MFWIEIGIRGDFFGDRWHIRLRARACKKHGRHLYLTDVRLAWIGYRHFLSSCHVATMHNLLYLPGR